MKHIKNTILCTLTLCLLLSSCEDGWMPECTNCTYIHPSNGSTVETFKCDDSPLIAEWEEDFKEQVRAIGGEWDSLEITCVREPL